MASRVRSPLRGGSPHLRGSRPHTHESADDTAELVVLGEILGATGFGDSCSHRSVLCKWAVVHGEHWTLAQGAKSGATQASAPSAHGGELAAWSHPIQLSFKTTSVQGWPKIVFAVYERDAWAGTDAFAAYGVASLPLSPGVHELECHTWRANDRNLCLKEQLTDFFAGARAELEGWKDALLNREEMFASTATSIGMGSVHLQLQVLTRGMDISGIHVGGMTQAAAVERARMLRDRRQHRAGQHRDTIEGTRDGSPSTSHDRHGRRFDASGSGSERGTEGDGRFSGGDSGETVGLSSVRRGIRNPEGTRVLSAPSDRLGAADGAGGIGRRLGRFSRDTGGGLQSQSPALPRFSGGGIGGASGDLPPRRSSRRAGATSTAGEDTSAELGGRRTSSSTLLSERRAAADAAAGGGSVSGDVAPTRHSAFSHQREQIEDAPLAPEARASRREARLSRLQGAGAGTSAAALPRASRASRRSASSNLGVDSAGY